MREGGAWKAVGSQQRPEGELPVLKGQRVAVAAGAASEECGAGRGPETKHRSLKELIPSVGSHTKVCLLTTPSIFFLLGAPDNGLLPKVLTTNVNAEACDRSGAQACRCCLCCVS